MFTAYFDEAGGEDLGFTFVAGAVAPASEWETFEVDWKLFLAMFRVPYLHMKEYSQNKACFSQWKDNESRRSEFLSMASEIITAHVKRLLLSIVSHAEFEEVNKIYELRETFNSPYALAGRTCIGLANAWSRNTSTQMLDINYVFEDGCPDKGGLLSAVEALPPFLPRPSFESGRDVAPSQNWPNGRIGLVPLQAADYLAYESRRVAFNIIRRGVRKPRMSLKALTGVPLDKSSFDKARLLRLCEGAGFPRRKGLN